MATKRRKSKSSNNRKKDSIAPSPRAADFLIAGVGASAGGVEAVVQQNDRSMAQQPRRPLCNPRMTMTLRYLLI
jgi:hypothetical protein